MGKLAVTYFVQNLAGFGVAIFVHILCLKRAENFQCTAGELRIDEGVLQRDDQAVASERGDKPRESSRRKEDQVVGPFDREAKSGHVLECLTKQTIKLLVARLDLDDLLEPIGHRLRVLWLVVTTDTLWRRRQHAIAIRESVEKTTMPCRTRLEDHLEAESAIGIDCPCRRAGHGNRQGATEVGIAVGRAQLLA